MRPRPLPASRTGAPQDQPDRATRSERRLFRQAALDRLASPEQLDTLLGLPSLRPGLVALAGAALALAAGLWWLLERLSLAAQLAPR
jgi:hypothetical protein